MIALACVLSFPDRECQLQCWLVSKWLLLGHSNHDSHCHCLYDRYPNQHTLTRVPNHRLSPVVTPDLRVLGPERHPLDKHRNPHWSVMVSTSSSSAAGGRSSASFDTSTISLFPCRVGFGVSPGSSMAGSLVAVAVPSGVTNFYKPTAYARPSVVSIMDGGHASVVPPQCHRRLFSATLPIAC